MQNRFALFFLLSCLLFCSPWAKALCFEGESPWRTIMKNDGQVWKSAKNYETILPFSCCPLVFLWFTANSVSSAKNSVSSLRHTNHRLQGTHWVRSPELSEPEKTHWVRCLKPYSPKPYSARFRIEAPPRKHFRCVQLAVFFGNVFLASRKLTAIDHLQTLDGGNCASLKGFWSRPSWGLENTIFKCISEPQYLPWLKHDY